MTRRRTAHKERNLADACPVHARPELKRDYDRIVYAASGFDARAAELPPIFATRIV